MMGCREWFERYICLYLLLKMFEMGTRRTGSQHKAKQIISVVGSVASLSASGLPSFLPTIDPLPP